MGTRTLIGLAVALFAVSAVLTAVEYRVTSRTLAAEWEVKSLELSRLLASALEQPVERGDKAWITKLLLHTTVGIETRSVTVVDREGRLLANSFNQLPGQPVTLPPDKLQQVLAGDVVSWVEEDPSSRSTRFVLAPVRGKAQGASDTADPTVLGAVLVELDQTFIDSLVAEHLRSLLFVNGISFAALLIMLWMVIRVSLVRPLSALTLSQSFTHMSEALRSSEALNQAVLNSLTEHIAVLDKDGAILTVNTAWSRFARENGHPLAAGAAGMNYPAACREVSGALTDTAREVLAGLQGVLSESRKQFALEYPCETPAGPRWYSLTATPLSRKEGGAVLAHQDITDRKTAEDLVRKSEAHFHAMAASQKQALAEQEQHLKELEAKNRELDQMAIRDPLTGLYNRRFFDEALAREWRRFQRTGEGCTVIVMDVDLFKHINDEYGHDAGDQALRLMGTALRSTLRESDLTARVGGDEFAAVLPGTDMEHSGPVIEKLADAVGKLRLSTAAGPITISLSIGAATVPGFPPVNSAAELLRVADKRMYEAKRTRSSGKPDAR